ncbi:MAG TPA: flagellar biosynthetic protein FliR [Myxococcota bacterium]
MNPDDLATLAGGPLDLAGVALPGKAAALMLVMARVTAFVSTAPVLSARFVPMRIRLMIGLALGFTAAVAADVQPIADFSPLLIVGETALGLVMGLAARAALEAALATGTLLSGQIGLSFASSVDPLSGTQGDVVSDLLSMLALLAAVGLGLHREAVVVICASVMHAPPGTMPDLMGVLDAAIPAVVGSIALAVRLAFPMMAVTSAGYVVMGIMARGSPALGLQGLGFTVPVLAGGFALYTMAPVAAEVAARTALTALHAFG